MSHLQRNVSFLEPGSTSRHRSWAPGTVQQQGQRCCCMQPRQTPPSCRSKLRRGERHFSTRSDHRSTSTNGPLPAVLTGVVVVGTAVAALQWFGPSLPASTAADLNPYQEAKQMVYGPTADGSIRGCPSNVNPNCISTGSINDAYSPAWRAGEPSPEQAAELLEDVITSKLEGARLLRSMSLKSGAEYRAFGVQSLFGEDVMEFVIKPESVQDRKWQGDAAGPLVTYRSMAGSVKYIWPIQQPVGDFDAQRKRMKVVRDELGWQIIGCELLECYQ